MRHWTPILVLLLAAVGSALIHVTLTKQYENWVTAPGEVTRIELLMGHSKHGSGKSQRIYYRYTVDGVSYEGSELFSGWDADCAEGDSAQIWYDPESPALSCYAKPGPGVAQFVPFIFAIPLEAALFLRSRRKNIGA